MDVSIAGAQPYRRRRQTMAPTHLATMNSTTTIATMNPSRNLPTEILPTA